MSGSFFTMVGLLLWYITRMSVRSPHRCVCTYAFMSHKSAHALPASGTMGSSSGSKKQDFGRLLFAEATTGRS